MLLKILILSLLSQLISCSNRGYFENGRYIDIIKSGEKIQTDSKDVVSLGRDAELGDFYDSRIDSFTGVSLFSSPLSNLTIHSVDNPYSDVNYIRTETVSEKISKLNIQAEIAVSTFFGLVPIFKGSGKYLKEDRKKFDSAKISFVYTVRTKTEVLKIFSQDCKTGMDIDLLDMIDATHVVVGVDWGADVVCSLEETKTDSSTKTEVEGMLGGALEGIALGTGIGFDAGAIESSRTFSIEFHGDVTPDVLPQTFNDSIKFIRNIPNLVTKVNGGKGKRMNYILMPIDTVRKVMKRQMLTGPKTFEEMSPSDLQNAIDLYQDLINSELIIKDTYDEIQEYQELAKDDFVKIKKLKADFDALAAEIKNNVTNSLIEIRRGRADPDILNRILIEYSNSNFTFENVSKDIRVFDETMAKIQVWDVLLEKARYLDRNFDRILIKNYKKEIRIISIDLDNLNVSRKVLDRVMDLLKSEGMSYYVKNSYVPNQGAVVNAYKEGNIIATYDLTIDRINYLLMKDENGFVTIIDAYTYGQFKSFQLPEIKNSMIATLNDSFYKIDALTGKVFSTSIDNLLNNTENLNWYIEGSFPAETDVPLNDIAYNKSEFFFVTSSGMLYNFDTLRKTVTKSGEITPSGNHTSMIRHKTDLYIYKGTKFYVYDGLNVTEIPIPNNLGEVRDSGLIMIKNTICRIGGYFTDSSENRIACYDPSTDPHWSVFVNDQSGLNVKKKNFALAFTTRGAIVIGGEKFDEEPSTSLELVDLNLRILKYLPSFFPHGLSAPQATSFWY